MQCSTHSIQMRESPKMKKQFLIPPSFFVQVSISAFCIFASSHTSNNFINNGGQNGPATAAPLPAPPSLY